MDRLIVIRQVRAIDPSSELDAIVDIVIEKDRIVRIGPGAGAEAAKAEWAQIIAPPPGAWIWPGLVDLHAHLREPGQEHKEDIETGLAAAAAGGFTDICAMPNTTPVNDSRMVTEAMLARAHEVGGTRLHPIGAITMGQRGESLTEMGDLREAGAVAVSDDGRCVTSSLIMRRALEYASVFDLPVIQHAEDHALTEGSQMHEGSVSTRLGLRGWPRIAEDIIVARDLMLAEYTNARYHVAHASTEGTVRLLREAKSRGLRVSAEVTPHHLLLTHEAVGLYDTACKVNPPLREERDVEALRAALADGTIDAVATDHAPHATLDKACEFAEAKPGMIGLELCVPLLLGLVEQGALPLHRLVTSLTQAPSSIARLPDKRLREGARADLVLIDPEERWTIDASQLRSKSRNTPFLGRNVKGRVKMTLVGGNVVFESATRPA